jgi:tRNA A58 N-methylase Trm61
MSACFAHLVGPTGHVYGVEHIAELVEQAHLNIQAADPNIVSRITIKGQSHALIHARTEHLVQREMDSQGGKNTGHTTQSTWEQLRRRFHAP